MYGIVSHKSNNIFAEDKTMGRMRENPRYNVISMRISDAERETLEQIMDTTKKSVSDIMREAMELVKSRSCGSELDKKAA
jgi:arsenate reductase-like glutaredoxin family protein